MQFRDWFNFSAAIPPASILFGFGLSLLGIRKMSLLWSRIWITAALLLVGLAWWSGAQQVAHNRDVENEGAETHDVVIRMARDLNIDSTLNIAQILKSIQARLGPEYPLNEQQEKSLKENLKLFEKDKRFAISIWYEDSSKYYASKLARVFRDAGWNVRLEAGLIIESSEFGIEIDLPQDVYDGIRSPGQEAESFMRLLDNSGVPFTKRAFRDLTGDRYEILVAPPM